MDPATWAAIAAMAAAVASISSLAYLLLEQRNARSHRRLVRHELGRTFEDRLASMYPKLRKTLGEVEDGLEPELRETIVPFLVLYSQVWAASREGLFDATDWQGLKAELSYWMHKPRAREAWAVLRDQEQAWPAGFARFVDDVLKESEQPLIAGTPPSRPGAKRHGDDGGTPASGDGGS